MKYVQLNLNGSYNRTLDSFDQIGVTEDTTKTIQNLTAEEKLELRLYALVTTPMPTFDPRSHWVREVTPVFINSICTQQWQVLELPAEQALANYEATKQNKSNQINDWRAKANQTYFVHAGKQVACDALSRSDIDAVAGSISLTGAFPVGFPPAWKATDNTYIPLPNVDAFKALYASMTLQGTINFGRSQELKTALAQATTLAQIDAITWN